jgi:hypothetical protein
MKHILFGAMALSAFLAAPAFAAEQIVRFEVGGLTCPSCSFIVGNSLKSVEGTVIESFVEGKDAGFGLYTVRFDDEVASTEALMAAVEENGYPIKVVPDAAMSEGS